MSKERPSMLSLVLIPAIITLVVTVVRVVGELQGWAPTLFSKEPGGAGALIGISWLIPVFGFWFGTSLSRRGDGPKAIGKSLMLYVLALVVFGGGLWAFVQAGLVVFPSEAAPGRPVGTPMVFGTLAAAAIVSIIAWPRLTLTLILYGFLARIPVIVVTYLDVFQGWDTHYGKLAPGFVAEGEMERFTDLSLVQATLWPFIMTATGGGVFGCIGAAVAGKRS